MRSLLKTERSSSFPSWTHLGCNAQRVLAAGQDPSAGAGYIRRGPIKKVLPLVLNQTEECCSLQTPSDCSPGMSCLSPGGERQTSSLALHAMCFHRMHWSVPGTSMGSGSQETPLNTRLQGLQGTARQELTQQSLEEFTLEDVRNFSNGSF